MSNKKIIIPAFFISILFLSLKKQNNESWIRINLLGYTTKGIKNAVWCSPGAESISSFSLHDSASGVVVFKNRAGKDFGEYGPFKKTKRLSFSAFTKPGVYYLKAGNAVSPFFRIDNDVYKGAADFCLFYMRQQRSGFNPFLNDSCHTNDGYTMYGPMPDSSHIDVSGGWHDASDYLQYAATSANATWHLLSAYRDFHGIFSDRHQANGLEGKNGLPDVLDEAKWGLSWLLKMHPRGDWMFNQVADDRDHQGMRIPKEDTFYGKGFERPVYFITGEPQQRGKFMNNTTGTSSAAAKFASVFALADYLCNTDTLFKRADKRRSYYDKAFEAYNYAIKKPGATQTVSIRSPYIYAEENWTDDMELAAASLHTMIINTATGKDNGYYMAQAVDYAKKEKITPWLGMDTAKHYQWYPFINTGHYELIKQLKSKQDGPVKGYFKNFIDNFWNNADSVTGYYKTGIQRVGTKANQNAFLRGIPFIWCSNNLTVSFAIQCYWYRQLTGDKAYAELEQANIDWLFGCNPWGTSMVYGLPPGGDYPIDPHSAFTHLKNYPVNGALVDGPVYTSIYKSLIGITLKDDDEYAAFQSGLAVYHDDYGDYSTNEPTMDGTASLVYLLAAKEYETVNPSEFLSVKGAIIRGNPGKKEIALTFTGDEFADGGKAIIKALNKYSIRANFFFTGNFYRNKSFESLIHSLKSGENYIGPHSDRHLLYNDWNNRDSLLVTKKEFITDLNANLAIMEKSGLRKQQVKYFLPPYEWYNDSIAAWSKEYGLQLINYTPGTLGAADYTWPALPNYRTSDEIFESVIKKEKESAEGLNGSILLFHIGSDPRRTDKFYDRLDELIATLKEKGYAFRRIDELLHQ
ncbi:MAG TPA: glycoside hydrolase family 9 protein [Ferruginibacter sp.]|nr:glycoside hydrolase family 9 protein [Ferruginibacter sp.]